MRFLADHDVWRHTVEFLRSLGDVLTVAQEGMAAAPDHEVLAFARRTGRALLTRDKGLGLLVEAAWTHSS